jgi:phosphoribosylformylglycinamidine synthase
MQDPRIHRELGLKDEEYARIIETLGREPTSTELAMYSVEWSEHCGYPRSRPLLGLFPRTGKYASRALGEDAGGVEVIPGLTVLFKMESHNHPSQVEPKQGAATGIGGIVRDIFTMGARPIALLDSLRFGELTEPHARYLLHGVVDGIQFYGNCIGVPTVGGEVYFNHCYSGNCLVNVMAVGTVATDAIVSARATGPGNAVMLVGNATGRDGIGGCSILASHEFGVSDQKRPTVQIGDPFTEKCLIEACLEALAHGGIVGLKDMGAAGITCTTCEMSAAGGVGMDIDLALVPRREAGMEPWELVMSESQERMLAVIEQGREEEVASIFRKWGLNAVAIGRVTEGGIMRFYDAGALVAEVPADSLANPPLYHLPYEEPAYLEGARALNLREIPEPEHCGQVLLDLLASPNIASKEWLYRQYDHMVQTNTVVLPGSGAAVLRLKGTSAGIAITTDGNGRYGYLDPYVGAQIAVAEAARNLVCSGADPAGVTDCLNFGNPEKPDRFWQFKRAVEGIAAACVAFEVPVVSGNVSFYNETPETAIHPTPVIGMVGVLEDLEHRRTPAFRHEGDAIVLLGDTFEELGGTEYLARIHGREEGLPPALDLEVEKRVQQCCLRLIREGHVRSANDCSDGGLAVCLAECCIAGGLGAEVELPASNARLDTLRLDSWLFGESQSRIVISVAPDHLLQVEEACAAAGVPTAVLGRVGGERFFVESGLTGLPRPVIKLPVAELARVYREAIPGIME